MNSIDDFDQSPDSGDSGDDPILEDDLDGDEDDEEEASEDEGAPFPIIDESSEEQLAAVGGVEIVYLPLEDFEVPADIKENLNAPDARKLLLARNLVPMQPRVMGLTLFGLMNDGNRLVAQTAENSLDDLPPNIVRNIVSQNLPWKVLDFFARNYYDDEDPDNIIQAIILNPVTGTDTLLLLARVSSPRILELIANNQARLAKTAQIVFELPKNPRVTIALLSRVLEFTRRQNLITVEDEDRIIDRFTNRFKASEAAPVQIEKVVREISTEEGEIDWEFPSFMTEDFESDLGLDATAANIEEKIKGKMNLRDLLREMTVPQKLRMAARGNMEARKILIEDALALVAREVLKSPRITKTEIERAAESRTIDPEVLTEIAKNAAFTRSYAVRHALVTNPKTPLVISNKMMGTLMEKDIKNISKSRAVPQAVASIARQKMDAQEQRRKKRAKKKKK
jgi:hypothetical protein